MSLHGTRTRENGGRSTQVARGRAAGSRPSPRTYLSFRPAYIGIVGLCLIWAGCGGSDIPDPDADAHAATQAAPSETTSPPAPVAVAAAPAPVATAEPTPAELAEPETVPAESVAAAEPAPAESAPAEPAKAEDQGKTQSPPFEAAAATPSPEAPAAQDEQLALADAPPSAESPFKEAAAPPAGSESPGGPQDAPPSPPANAPAGSAPSPPGGPSPFPTDNASTSPGPRAGGTPAQPPAGPGASNPDTGGPNPGAPPNPGMPGADPGANEAPSFRNPVEAVNSFLDALKAKDLDRLAEATALRSRTEASPRNRDLFSAILDKTLAEEDLSELATKLEGFQVAFWDAPHSTGVWKIVLQKQGQNGSILRRTIVTRKEKAGWKVLDISGQGEIERPIMMPRYGRGYPGGRR